MKNMGKKVGKVSGQVRGDQARNIVNHVNGGRGRVGLKAPSSNGDGRKILSSFFCSKIYERTLGNSNGWAPV